MIPIIRAIDKWGKQQKKDFLKAVDSEYEYATNYFFGKRKTKSL